MLKGFFYYIKNDAFGAKQVCVLDKRGEAFVTSDYSMKESGSKNVIIGGMIYARKVDEFQ